MKNKLLMSFGLIVFGFAVTGADNLFYNGTFARTAPVPPDTVNFLRTQLDDVQLPALPVGWRFTTNSRKIPGGKIAVSAPAGKRAVVAVEAPSCEIVFYCFSRRLKLDTLKNRDLKMKIAAFGSGRIIPIFFGYDRNNRCVYYKAAASAALNPKNMPAPVVVNTSMLNERGATEVAVGFAIRGKAKLYGAELFALTTHEAAELRRAETLRQQAFTLRNGSFETADDWQLVRHDGAEGEFVRIPGGRSGKLAARITKRSGAGFLQLVSTRPIKVRKGELYTFRGYFQTRDSPLSCLLLFRVTPTAHDANFRYDDVDRSFGYTSQSMLIQSAPGQWNKRLAHYRAKEDGEVYVNIILHGNPATVLLDDLAWEDAAVFQRPAPADLTKRTTFPYSEKQVYDFLRTRPRAEAHLRRAGGSTELVLNGKAVTPVLYKSEGFHSDYVYNRFAEFAAAGVPFAIKTVQLSNSRTDSGVVSGPGKYDFKKLETVLMYALRQNPALNLVVDFQFNEPYPGWGLAHPDELWRNAEGKFGYGTWGNCDGFVRNLAEAKLSPHYRRLGVKPWPFASYSSELYRQAQCRAVTDLVTHLMASPLGKAIAGFHIGGGHDAQFQYFRNDFSLPAQRAFRKFLRNRYSSIDQLNRAWKSRYKNFDEITIPSGPRTEGSPEPLLADGPICAYRSFQWSESAAIKHEFANAARQAAGKPVFVSAYGHPMEYHTRSFAATSEGVDLQAVPSWYPFRQMGYPVGAAPDGSLALHGKMWLNEMDLRTWTEPARDELYDMWIGSAVNLPFWQSVNRKFAGVALAARSAWWYYSMYRYFDRPEVMREIAATVRAARKVAAAAPIAFRPEVCVVRSEPSDDRIAAHSSSERNEVGFPWQYQMLECSGVPFDVYNLEDILERPELQTYRMYLFVNTGGITSPQRRAIAQKLKNNRKVLVFLYNAGYSDETGNSVEHMRELTGFQVNAAAGYGRAVPLLVPDHPLTRGVPPFISGGEFRCAMLAVRGVSPHQARYQIFALRDAAEDEVLARYQHNRQPAMAIRDHGTWTSLYSAAPFSLLPEFVNNLAARYGIYRVADAGTSIHMNGNFISAHGVKQRSVTLNVPRGTAHVSDLFTNEILPVQAGRCVLPIKWGETRWLLLEPESQTGHDKK